MNNQVIEVTEKNAKNILEELYEAFYDIPFENSAFQTEAFVISSQITPERAYRAIGLQLFSKVQKLQDFVLGQELRQVDLDELEFKSNDINIDQFERRRAEINLRRMKENINFENKLLNDAIHEVNLLYKHFKKMPRYTRDQFEAAEYEHYEQKMMRMSSGINDSVEALINMREDLPAIKAFQEKIELLDNISSQTLNELMVSMPNKLKDKNKNAK